VVAKFLQVTDNRSPDTDKREPNRPRRRVSICRAENDANLTGHVPHLPRPRTTRARPWSIRNRAKTDTHAHSCIVNATEQQHRTLLVVHSVVGCDATKNLHRGFLSFQSRVVSMSTRPPAAPTPKKRSLSYRLHDALNVPLVGGLSVMCILGLLGLMDAHLITKIFIAYVVVDGLWIAVSPSAVPKHAWAIVLHHVLTFFILLHPLRYPEHAIETCRDGIVEVNTFFLIVRRNTPRGSIVNRVCDVLYHWTLSIRFFWQPYLIYHFRIITHTDSTDRPGGYALAEHCMVMVSQVMLCVFNIMIVLPGLLAKKKKKKDA